MLEEIILKCVWIICWEFITLSLSASNKIISHSIEVHLNAYF